MDVHPTRNPGNSYGIPNRYLPTANEVCEGYVFTGFLSVHRGGSTLEGTPRGEYLGRYPQASTPPGRYTPLAGTPPLGRYPLRQVHPPGQVCPLGRYIPPGWYIPGQVPPQAGTTPWQVHPPPPPSTPSHSACWDTVNKRAVRTPLECILVSCIYFENIVKMYD